MLNIVELNKVHENRKKQKEEVYKYVYNKICERIKYLNNQLYLKECTYDIPNIIWGYPIYDIQACVCYIMVKLRKDEIFVQYIYPRRLYISWDIALKELKKKEINKDIKMITNESEKINNVNYVPMIQQVEKLEQSFSYKPKGDYGKRREFIKKASHFGNGPLYNLDRLIEQRKRELLEIEQGNKPDKTPDSLKRLHKKSKKL